MRRIKKEQKLTVWPDLRLSGASCGGLVKRVEWVSLILRSCSVACDGLGINGNVAVSLRWLQTDWRLRRIWRRVCASCTCFLRRAAGAEKGTDPSIPLPLIGCFRSRPSEGRERNGGTRWLKSAAFDCLPAPFVGEVGGAGGGDADAAGVDAPLGPLLAAVGGAGGGDVGAAGEGAGPIPPLAAVGGAGLAVAGGIPAAARAGFRECRGFFRPVMVPAGRRIRRSSRIVRQNCRFGRALERMRSRRLLEWGSICVVM